MEHDLPWNPLPGLYLDLTLTSCPGSTVWVMERKDAIAAVIAGTGILAATTIAGLAVVKLASPQTTGIAETVSITEPSPVVLPELATAVPLVPQLPATAEPATEANQSAAPAPMQAPQQGNAQPAYSGEEEYEEEEYEEEEYEEEEYEGSDEGEHDNDDD